MNELTYRVVNPNEIEVYMGSGHIGTIDNHGDYYVFESGIYELHSWLLRELANKLDELNIN
jgi:hypothetical protein